MNKKRQPTKEELFAEIDVLLSIITRSVPDGALTDRDRQTINEATSIIDAEYRRVERIEQARLSLGIVSELG